MGLGGMGLSVVTVPIVANINLSEILYTCSGQVVIQVSEQNNIYVIFVNIMLTTIL
jgi:hypothetical protein